MFWGNALSDAPKTKEQLGQSTIWVDVRDLAEGHVLALEKEKAGGERIFISAGQGVWQDFGECQGFNLAVESYWWDCGLAVDAAIKLNIPGRKVFPGFPEVSRKSIISLSTTKAADILGVKTRSVEEIVRDSFEDFAKRGFWVLKGWNCEVSMM
jgi:nucleoside-diphosphate-sugar epimerase